MNKKLNLEHDEITHDLEEFCVIMPGSLGKVNQCFRDAYLLYLQRQRVNQA